MEDIICSDHHILPIINSFGFTLGFGEQTVKEACQKQKIDITTFISVINFVRNQEYDPNQASSFPPNMSLRTLQNYIQRSHDHFLHHRLPATRRHLIEAIDCSGDDKIPYLFLKFFDLFSTEIERHATYEKTHIHPYVDQLLQGIHLTQNHNIQLLMKKQKEHHDIIRKKISDLTHTIVKYYKNQKKNQIMNDVLYELFIMKEDFEYHSLIEERIFTACVHTFEEKSQSSSEYKKNIHPAYPTKTQTSFDLLSKREKEIICLVTQGLSNKKIADQLNISINTVLTHRRHINKKLEIHSPTELTIHAILNGMISIHETKLCNKV